MAELNLDRSPVMWHSKPGSCSAEQTCLVCWCSCWQSRSICKHLLLEVFYAFWTNKHFVTEDTVILCVNLINISERSVEAMRPADFILKLVKSFSQCFLMNVDDNKTLQAGFRLGICNKNINLQFHTSSEKPVDTFVCTDHLQSSPPCGCKKPLRRKTD